VIDLKMIVSGGWLGSLGEEGRGKLR